MTRDRDREDAEKYRLAQARKLLSLFEDAHGRPATTTEELFDWMVRQKAKAERAPS